VLDGLVYWGARYLGRSLYGTLTIKRYCRLLLGRQEHRYLHVPSRLDDVKLDIDAVYVALSLESRGMQATYSHRDLLTLGNRIHVVGDPGSGKSSLVKRLLRDACRNAIAAPSASSLPVLCELKNLQIPGDVAAADLGEWLYEFSARGGWPRSRWPPRAHWSS
jgi:hypothetical protein